MMIREYETQTMMHAEAARKAASGHVTPMQHSPVRGKVGEGISRIENMNANSLNFYPQDSEGKRAATQMSN